MPIYEYQCKACGHEFEQIQKFSDAPLKKCSACGKDQLGKLISRSGFHLKGSGWYVTDYKNKPKPQVESAEKKSSGKSDKSEKKIPEAKKASSDKSDKKTTESKS